MPACTLIYWRYEQTFEYNFNKEIYIERDDPLTLTIFYTEKNDFYVGNTCKLNKNSI